MTIEKILQERGDRYGSFDTHAKISQELKNVMFCRTAWQSLEPDQKEALEMTVHKIARILNGDPNYIDNWDDIAGYATLVANRLRGNSD